VKSDKPVAQLIARLCDVAPDGSSRRVSYGVLNLTHRDDHAAPSPLEPGRLYRVHLALNDCGYAFPAGHRIRLSLSTSYWPLLWPAPEPATLTVSTAAATLALPVRASDASDAAIRFLPAEQGPMAPISRVAPGRFARETKLDLVSGTATYVTDGEGGVFGDGVTRFDEIGTIINHSLRRELSIHADNPLSAHATVTQIYDIGSQGWKIRIEVRTEMTATKKEFRLTATLNAYENSVLAAARHWNEAIARDLV
jgi:hypothetical protein